MRKTLSKLQLWILCILSLVVAFVLLVNFVLEFKKIAFRRHITQSVPSLIAEENSLQSPVKTSGRLSYREVTHKKGERRKKDLQPAPKADPLKYGTLAIVKKEAGEKIPQDTQIQGISSPQKVEQKQAANILAQRVKEIFPNFDSEVQKRINAAIDSPSLIPEAIKYIDTLIDACAISLAENEDDLVAATKKDNLGILRSVLVSVLNEQRN